MHKIICLTLCLLALLIGSGCATSQPDPNSIQASQSTETSKSLPSVKKNLEPRGQEPPTVTSEPFLSPGEALSAGAIGAALHSNVNGADKITITVECETQGDPIGGFAKPIKNLQIDAHIFYKNLKTSVKSEKLENLTSNDKGVFYIFLDSRNNIVFEHADVKFYGFPTSLSKMESYRVTFHDCALRP